MAEIPSQPFDCVYVSPHLDDVVFSCSAKILSDRRMGRRILVATLYSSPGTDAAADAQREYSARRLEDDQALDALECTAWRADRTDAPYRSRVYRSFAGITQGWDRKDRHELAQVTEVLRVLLRTIGPKEVYGPLGVGGHIDHRICHEALRRAVDGLPSTTRVGFYEDRPYVFVRESLALRLTELNWSASLQPRSVQWRAKDFFKDFFASPYVKAYLGGRPERLRVMARYAYLLTRAQPSPWATEAMVYHFGPTVADEILSTIQSYKSQLTEFFGGPEGWRHMSAAYHRHIGYPNRYVERFWKLPYRTEA